MKKSNNSALLKNMKSKEPSKYITICDVTYNPKKLSHGRYRYGDAFMRKLPTSRIERMLVVPKGTIVNSKFLVLDPFDARKVNVIPTNSRFFAVLASIISGLSIAGKLKLLRQAGLPTEEM
jgi:hypothetical protein